MMLIDVNMMLDMMLIDLPAFRFFPHPMSSSLITETAAAPLTQQRRTTYGPMT